MSETELKKQEQEQEVNLLELVTLFLKRKMFIVGGTLAFVVVIEVCCLVMSPVFDTAATLMPPQQSSAASALILGQLGGAAAGMLSSMGATTTTGDLYVGLVKINPILDPIIDRFKLIELYDKDTREETRKKILDDILNPVNDTVSGIVSITVSDIDPQRGANIANAFVEELTKVFDRVSNTDGGKRRIFFEKELRKAHEALADAEVALQGFSENTGVIKMDDQSSAVIQGIAALKAQIAAQEVQLRVMKSYATISNPDLKKAEEQLGGLQDQLKKLEEKEEKFSANPIMPTGQIPELGTEYIRILREFKFRQDLWDILVKQYEAARLDEAREALVVQVIGQATPSDKKVRPSLGLIGIVAFVMGLFLFTLAGFAQEYVERVGENPKNELGLQSFKRFLKKF